MESKITKSYENLNITKNNAMKMINLTTKVNECFDDSDNSEVSPHNKGLLSVYNKKFTTNMKI